MKTGHGAWFVRVLAAVCVATSAGAQGPFPLIHLDGTSPALHSAVTADGQAISLNFQNIDIRALLQVFAEFTGLNLVVSDAVSGQVSVRLLDVPWVQALGVVLESKGLTSRREGKVMWVAPKDEWALREKKHLEAQAALESVSPLQMLSLRLKYARATEVAQRLSGAAGAGAPLRVGGTLRAGQRAQGDRAPRCAVRQRLCVPLRGLPAASVVRVEPRTLDERERRTRARRFFCHRAAHLKGFGGLYRFSAKSNTYIRFLKGFVLDSHNSFNVCSCQYLDFLILGSGRCSRHANATYRKPSA